MDRENLPRRLAFFATIPALVLLWHLVSGAGGHDRLLPGPIDVGQAFLVLIDEGVLFRDIEVSVLRAGGGLVIGVALGFLFGVGTGVSPVLSASLGQVLNILRSLPAISIIPFAIIWLGIGEVAKLAIIAFAVTFPVWVNTFLGVQRVDHRLIWVAQSLGLKGLPLVTRVIVPSAVPQIIAGVRIGIGLAFVSLFASEMAGAIGGVGYRIYISHLVFRVDVMIAMLFVLGGLGVLFDTVFVLICKKAFPWIYVAAKTDANGFNANDAG
jgi:ABC-type nitrate/sulfonate/bicarbonate transport system permease component